MERNKEHISTEEEKELIRQLKSPDEKRFAFYRLVLLYQEGLYALIRRMVISHEDTDDILQEVLLKVWQKVGGFRGDSGLYTWLYRIAVNESLLFLKRKKRRFYLPIHNLTKELEDKTEESFVDGNEIEKKLMKAVASLPEKQKAVFILRYFQEMSYEEISQVLNTSIGGLKASYHHAVKKIEKQVQL